MVYRVFNTSRNQELASAAERADTFWTRLVGLMGRTSLPAGGGLHLLDCNAIHTFFMRMPIDVIFLSEANEVVRLFHSLRPWRATSVYVRARSVLELPAGSLANSSTAEGDRLTFQGIERL